MNDNFYKQKYLALKNLYGGFGPQGGSARINTKKKEQKFKKYEKTRRA